VGRKLCLRCQLQTYKMDSLQERMAALKSKHDTKVRSDDKTPTPLSVFIHIYIKAEHECYINYMEGAIALADYLSPIAIPLMPDIIVHTPRMLCSYELTELAQHLATDRYNLAEVRHIERLIAEDILMVQE